MMRFILFYAVSFLLCLTVENAKRIFSDTPIFDPDIFRNVSGLIESKGYAMEEHWVQTRDGYILSLLRIPHGRNSNSEKDKKDVVLLIPGLLADASCYVVDFPEQSIGFVLPDAGYDTWLINLRGCTYSRKHVTYKTHEKRFWNFSFDEFAEHDIPATIDYILDASKKENLFLIGMSEGTTATFAMLTEMPDYNDKVKLFIALAPVTSVGYVTTAPRLLAPLSMEIADALEIIHNGEYLPHTVLMNKISGILCAYVIPDVCEWVLFSLGGVDREQMNKSRIGVYMSHFPSITSVKSIYHYAQMTKSKKFCKYDYGSYNLQYYQQEEPPEYDLSRITTPVALFWSTNDALADTTDVNILRSKLNSLVFDHLIPYPYDHFDFIWAMNGDELINKPVLQLLAQY